MRLGWVSKLRLNCQDPSCFECPSTQLNTRLANGRARRHDSCLRMRHMPDLKMSPVTEGVDREQPPESRGKQTAHIKKVVLMEKSKDAESSSTQRPLNTRKSLSKNSQAFGCSSVIVTHSSFKNRLKSRPLLKVLLMTKATGPSPSPSPSPEEKTAAGWSSGFRAVFILYRMLQIFGRPLKI